METNGIADHFSKEELDVRNGYWLLEEMDRDNLMEHEPGPPSQLQFLFFQMLLFKEHPI